MSNLSEEEVIEKIKHLIKSSNDRTDLLNYLDEKTKESLQGLLDLYQQEKEKNKELNEFFLMDKNEIEKFYISKEKIKKLLDKYVGCYMKFYEKIQDLLEEE